MEAAGRARLCTPPAAQLQEQRGSSSGAGMPICNCVLVLVVLLHFYLPTLFSCLEAARGTWLSDNMI